MIGIRIESGPEKGRTKRYEETREPLQAYAFLDEIASSGCEWSLNFRAASLDEAYAWGFADLICRIDRALNAGRGVSLEGRRYAAAPEAFRVVRDVLGEAIKTSTGRGLTFSDDPSEDLLIELRDPDTWIPDALRAGHIVGLGRRAWRPRDPEAAQRAASEIAEAIRDLGDRTVVVFGRPKEMIVITAIDEP